MNIKNNSFLFTRHNELDIGPINTYNIFDKICGFNDSFAIVILVIVLSY
jgi:hypothetical protein